MKPEQQGKGCAGCQWNYQLPVNQEQKLEANRLRYVGDSKWIIIEDPSEEHALVRGTAIWQHVMQLEQSPKWIRNDQNTWGRVIESILKTSARSTLWCGARLFSRSQNNQENKKKRFPKRMRLTHVGNSKWITIEDPSEEHALVRGTVIEHSENDRTRNLNDIGEAYVIVATRAE